MIQGYFNITKTAGEVIIAAKCGTCGVEMIHAIKNEQLGANDPVHVAHMHKWSQKPPLCSACVPYDFTPQGASASQEID